MDTALPIDNVGTPPGFDAKSRLNLGVIIRPIGGLMGFYYLGAGKWRY